MKICANRVTTESATDQSSYYYPLNSFAFLAWHSDQQQAALFDPRVKYSTWLNHSSPFRKGRPRGTLANRTGRHFSCSGAYRHMMHESMPPVPSSICGTQSGLY